MDYCYSIHMKRKLWSKYGHLLIMSVELRAVVRSVSLKWDGGGGGTLTLSSKDFQKGSLKINMRYQRSIHCMAIQSCVAPYIHSLVDTYFKDLEASVLAGCTAFFPKSKVRKLCKG